MERYLDQTYRGAELLLRSYQSSYTHVYAHKYTYTHVFLWIHMQGDPERTSYTCRSLDMCACIFSWCEFCPEPGKHIGQPPDFGERAEDMIAVSSEEEEGAEELEIDESQYVWDAVPDKRMRKCMSCKNDNTYWQHGLCTNRDCVTTLVAIERVLSFRSWAPRHMCMCTGADGSFVFIHMCEHVHMYSSGASLLCHSYGL